MIKYIFLILLLPSLCFAQAIINTKTDKRVEEGRIAVDKFRVAHIKLYTDKVWTGSAEGALRPIMTWELSRAGFTGDKINNFFKTSDDYNIKLMGYDTIEELVKAWEKNEALLVIYNNLWR